MSTFKLFSAPKRLLLKVLRREGTKLTGSLFYIDTSLNERPINKAYGDRYYCPKHKYFDKYCDDCQKHLTFSP